jgi:K+:H+ antiporter
MGATLTVAGYSPLELGSGMPNRLRPPVGGRLVAESWSIGPTRDGKRPANGLLAGGCGSEAPKARPTGSTNRQKPQHVPTPHSGQLLPSIVTAVIITFVLGLLAARRHLRPHVGYLLAGVAIGPFTPGFVDTGFAQQFVEIGVILLMFEVGLHLSVADLATVRPIAVWGALAQIAVSVPAGVGLALAWGWTTAAGSLLGLASSVASTVVVLRMLAERHALDDSGRLVVGWLIVQDLVIVLVLVLLPTLAGRGEAASGFSDLAAELAVIVVAKVALFGLLIVVGKQVVPKLLEFVARAGSRELFTLSLLAIALGIAYGLSELFGVSFTLGAFFAGVVLKESGLNRHATAGSLLLRDAFAVLFFVSVGMLFDPAVLLREPLQVAAVLLVIVVVKSLAAVAVMLLCRQPLATALRVSAALAQTGEFSFILAGLGVHLGMLPPEGDDLILASILLSITANPVAFDLAGRLARHIASNSRSRRG